MYKILKKQLPKKIDKKLYWELNIGSFKEFNEGLSQFNTSLTYNVFHKIRKKYIPLESEIEAKTEKEYISCNKKLVIDNEGNRNMVKIISYENYNIVSGKNIDMKLYLKNEERMSSIFFPPQKTYQRIEKITTFIHKSDFYDINFKIIHNELLKDKDCRYNITIKCPIKKTGSSRVPLKVLMDDLEKILSIPNVKIERDSRRKLIM